MGEPGEKGIHKDIKQAIVAPPKDKLEAFKPERPGAIRRVKLPAGMKKVAFTFDLCEQPYEVAGYDSDIIKILRRENVRATFFTGGKWMLTHPERTQQLIADPLFEMANHSWEHRNLRLLDGQRLSHEVGWAQAAYERQAKALAGRQCAGRTGKPFTLTPANSRMKYFRFPFGACDPEALRAVADLGLIPIQWDISSGDPTKTLSAASMAAAVVRQVRPGSIVLFHANGRGWSTAAALEIMIPKLKAMGYEFATVGDLLTTKGAEWVQEDICYDSRPHDVDRHDDLAIKLDAAYKRFYAKFGVEDPAKTTIAPGKAAPPKDTSGPSPPADGPPREAAGTPPPARRDPPEPVLAKRPAKSAEPEPSPDALDGQVRGDSSSD